MAGEEIRDTNENEVVQDEIETNEDTEEEDDFDWDTFLGDIDLEDITPSDEKEEIYSSRNFINQEKDSYIRFDKEFRKFLANFVKQQKKKEKQKSILKYWFFGIIMAGFFVLLITPLATIGMCHGKPSATLVTSLITTLIELVSAIIVLPKIIADYLFNKEEDSNMMDIIKSMQDYNEKKHDYIEKHKRDG